MSNLSDYKKAAQELAAPQHKDSTLDDLDKILKPWSSLIAANYGEPSGENTYAVSLYKVHEQAKQELLNWRDKAVVEARIDELNNVVIATDIDDIGRSMSAYIQKRKAQLKETPNED